MILERVQTRDVWRYSLVAVLIAVIVAAVAVYLPAPVDWRTAFRPAARAMLLTGDPYQVEGFFNPPWTVLPMIPLAFLPEQIGAALMFVAGLAGFAFAAHRLGASPIVLGAFILSPPVMHSLLNGNIDWLPLVGFVLPPQIGLFFILIKPQMGLAVALFWLVEAWREGGLREVIRVLGLLVRLWLSAWPCTACGRCARVRRWGCGGTPVSGQCRSRSVLRWSPRRCVRGALSTRWALRHASRRTCCCMPGRAHWRPY